MDLSCTQIVKILKNEGHFHRVSCDVEHLKKDFEEASLFKKFARFVRKKMRYKPLVVHYRDLKPFVDRFMGECS